MTKSRGEQFRHSQNVRGRSRTDLSRSLAFLTHNAPTLPAGLTGLGNPSWSPEPEKKEDVDSALKVPPGPPAPKSWRLTTSKKDIYDSAAWRAHTLSIITSGRSQSIESMGRTDVPPLTLLCLRILVTCYSSADFIEYILPFIPPHLRRDLLRYTAVHSPLPDSKLYPLCEPDGHVDGELIVVGPRATLPENHFRRNPSLTSTHLPDLEESESEEHHDAEDAWDWESSSHDERVPTSPHTIALINVHVPMSAFLNLPPTLTHLALINIPFPVSLHRLPGLCPLLVVLDLSYNNWLSPSYKDEILERVDWTRFSKLHTLAFRGCSIPQDIIRRVNKGRWDDVEVICG